MRHTAALWLRTPWRELSVSDPRRSTSEGQRRRPERTSHSRTKAAAEKGPARRKERCRKARPARPPASPHASTHRPPSRSSFAAVRPSAVPPPCLRREQASPFGLPPHRSPPAGWPRPHVIVHQMVHVLGGRQVDHRNEYDGPQPHQEPKLSVRRELRQQAVLRQNPDDEPTKAEVANPG